MNDTLITAIQSFTLQARTDMEREAHEQLEGLYGWLPDGSFAPEKQYPALTLTEARETRGRLEQYARDEAEAGFDASGARLRLVRETAFTWLNRFVAFKMLETRRVLKTILAPPDRANAYKFWVADGHDPQAQALHDAGDVPLNALGEGPRQIAYRRFILWQCGELAPEMSVLFDPATLASRLCPRPNALHEFVETLNAAELTTAWAAGNEETVGWVYEGFIEEDNKRVFEKFGKGKKVLPEEIGAATQRFTPRWIVKFLVENSLGRLWMELHPDSALKNKMEYFVPPAGGPTARSLKLAREILFLDPSCGSMHFGLVAFDLFVEMYREEMACVGHPGWPAIPSVATEAEIPAAIVANNLHGIDIDPRAVQIAALTLLIKARGLNRDADVTDRNLACCNVEAITGGRLDTMIQGAKFDQAVYERILRAMAARLMDSAHLGSLLRPERDLERLIDEERVKLDRSVELLPGLGESDLSALDTPEKRETFFVSLSSNISQQLDVFVRQSRTTGKDESHFVGETAKGLNFLRLAQQRYDVVATNPPYMSRRNMSDIMARHLDEEYAETKGDLYAAFIARCVELTDPLGQTAMVTQQSFMFISSYEKMRQNLRVSVTIQSMAHLGPRAFPNITGEKVNTTAFVFEKQLDAKRRDENVGVYFRLVKERDADAKRLAFESASTAYRAGLTHPQVFAYKQSDFDAIPGMPWVYWITQRVRLVFKEHRSISAIAKPKHGMATADNFRFLRKWYEIGRCEIGFGLLKTDQATACGKKWFPYMKGGPVIPWYGNMDHVVNYGMDGYELKAWADPLYGNSGWSRSLVSAGSYFQRGVTWSLISSSGFAARLSPGGFVFDVAGMTCFPPEHLLRRFLAVMNCPLARFLLSAINPTINFQVCDIERLPVPSGVSHKIDNLVDQCITFSRQNCCEDETTYDFVNPLRNVEDLTERQVRLHTTEAEIDAEMSRLYDLSEEDLTVIDLELNGPAVAQKEEEAEGGDKDENVQALELSQDEFSRRWISYAIGTVLGRFEIGSVGGLGCGDFPEPIVAEIKTLIDTDGIMPCEAGHAQDIAARALACLNLMLGINAAREKLHTAFGEGDSLNTLRGWLDRFTGQPAQSFWRYHHQMYHKRPVYWPFQSPKRLYTVWVFHLKIGPDTLFRIRNDFVEPRLRLAEREIADLRVRAVKDRNAAKELDRVLDFADDLRAFVERLRDIAERGYTSQIDDGVLLNAAPLNDVLASWPDTRAAWEELAAGKYDWAHQAMAYWPDRVKAACLTNKSFAIAHGLAGPESPKTPASAAPKRKGRKLRMAEEEDV